MTASKNAVVPTAAHGRGQDVVIVQVQMNTLFKKICTKDHILASYHLIREKKYNPYLDAYHKYVPGIDGLTVQDCDKNLDPIMDQCYEFLKSGVQEFYPQILRKIRKHEPGTYREVYINSLRDKIIQKAIADPMAQHLERHFYPNLYSYRRGKYYGNITAAARVQQILKENNHHLHIFKTDIPDYTDNLRQDRLLAKFRAVLPNEPIILSFLEKFIRQRKCAQGVLSSPILGIPSGSSLTPICANLYLSELDQQMFRNGYHYLRFGDDLLLLTKTHQELEAGQALITEIVTAHDLQIKAEKTIIAAPGTPFVYLGYQFADGKIGPGPNALGKYRAWVRSLFPRYHFQNEPHQTVRQRRRLLQAALRALNTETERGMPQLSWIRGFQIIDDNREIRKLDRFIKDRIRSCITQSHSSKNKQLVPEAWFRELGYKSLSGAYFRIRHRRPLGPYHGWRRYFGTNYQARLQDHQPKSYLQRKWQSLLYNVRFVRDSLRGQMPPVSRHRTRASRRPA